MLDVNDWSASVEVRNGGLEEPQVRALLAEHLEEMRATSPMESVHALEVAALDRPEISFWSAWRGPSLVGCSALKQLDPGHGEIKSMRVARSSRRRGAGALLVSHLKVEARRRGYRRLSLETGSQELFEPARHLYVEHGFVVSGPFADYIDDPNSVFMTQSL